MSDRKLEKMLDDVTQWERPFTPNQVEHPPSTPYHIGGDAKEGGEQIQGEGWPPA